MSDSRKPGQIVNPQTGQSVSESLTTPPKKPLDLSGAPSSSEPMQMGKKKHSLAAEVSFHSDQVKYRDPTKSRASGKSISLWLVLAFISSGLIWYFADPHGVRTLAARSMALIAEQVPAVKPYLPVKGVETPKNPVIAPQDLSLDGLNCEALIEKALSMKVRGWLSAEGAQRLATCYLFQNVTASSQELLQEYEAPVLREKSKWSAEDIEGYHLYLETLLARWKLGQATDQAFLNCRGWKWTPACIGKLLVYARTVRYRDAEKGYLKLQAMGQRFGKKAHIRTLIAGAISARKMERFDLAKLRIKQVFSALLTDSFYLRRMALLEGVKIAYFSKDQAFAKEVFQNYRRWVPKEDRKDYANIDVLYAVQRPKLSKRALALFFGRRGMYQRYTGDPELVAILAYEGIRVGLAPAVDSYFSFLIVHMVQQHQLDTMGRNWLHTWRARAYLALDRYGQALSELNVVRYKSLKNPEYYYLKGLAYLNYTEQENHKIFAVNEFQKMINLSNDWQGYYGAVMGLVPSKDAQRINLLFKSWPGVGPQKEGRRWYMFSRLKAAIILNDQKAAKELAQRLMREYPDFRYGLEFLQVYFESHNDFKSLEVVNRSLLALGSGEKYEVSTENPLSPLALPVFYIHQ
ncbi:hypothetical protein [Pseudobacteriovorax antillogorgiicola]|uniref:Tetratricopeptide repeat-containing protein n=1 Tax=Pseudobacteriovorax antillogorgiicola TaxID=1513793 RepID=A0A1Y6B973_9BACT|nr:hypothetical protein [Pseudobacteriovorax antillogorgiicola]TCS59439.1 hypothetical protein EDD56_101350 [Pseudobacteriovorax antillogorgiicola]SME88278.1 hypothetical protein SAMN06296036_101135 [Pseudobacteriovorax antillogorgiicola]